MTALTYRYYRDGTNVPTWNQYCEDIGITKRTDLVPNGTRLVRLLSGYSQIKRVHATRSVLNPMNDERPVKCLLPGCDVLIENPVVKNGEIKKFCSNKHRWLYHNVHKKNELKAFAEEINDLLERHGLLRKRA